MLYDNNHISLQLSAVKALCWRVEESKQNSLNMVVKATIYQSICPDSISLFPPPFLITSRAVELREL